MDVVVVLPTYNEASNIERAVTEALRASEQVRVLVIDDSSPDGTAEIVRGLQSRYRGRVDLLVRPAKEGLGAAYRQGFEHVCRTSADVVVQMDADGSHPVSAVPGMVEAVARGAGLVIGSRYVSGGSVDDSWPTHRLALSRFGNFYARRALGLRVRDLTGGFKAWDTDVLRRLDLRGANASGYAFQIQTTLGAAKCGASIVEVPIHFAERRAGTSKMSTAIALEAMTGVWAVRRATRTTSR